MKNIKHLLDVVDKVRDHVALGLMSDPGLSKTSQVKQWAEDNGRRYCELIISQRMPSEISGMPMPVQDTKKMEVFDFETLLELEDGDVLAFDEFTNGNIQTLNACLTLIQERTMLSGKKLPSLIIVAMGNPQGKCDLLPQTKQRFLWVNVVWDEQTWAKYMLDTWGFVADKVVLTTISEQYREGFGDTHKFNYLTPRTVENLFRISQTIKEDDIFWTTFGIPPKLLSSLYNRGSGIDQFTKMKSRMLEFMATQEHSTANDLLTASIMNCQTARDLGNLFESIVHNNLSPELVMFMKTMEDSDE